MRRLLALAAAFTVGCAALLHPVRLATDDPIRAPHARHTAAKVECLTCHESVYDQKALGEGQVLPDEAKCLECHADVKDKGQCATCHTNVKRAATWVDHLTPGLKMSHKDHIERVKEDCGKCHTRLPDEVASPVGEKRPTMDSCRTCHEKDYEAGKCEKCHTDLSHQPLKPVASFRHDGNFVREHGRIARGDDASCATCHDQTFCTDCHATTAHPQIELKMPEKVNADFIHRNDFLGRHSVEAENDPATCRRCHGDSFCSTCHTAQNLTAAAVNPRDPHPQGWSYPGSKEFHGDAARRDILNCASCHDDGAASICINCHKVGGIGGDPHPSGFQRQHDLKEARSTRMCLYCHGQ